MLHILYQKSCTAAPSPFQLLKRPHFTPSPFPWTTNLQECPDDISTSKTKTSTIFLWCGYRVIVNYILAPLHFAACVYEFSITINELVPLDIFLRSQTCTEVFRRQSKTLPADKSAKFFFPSVCVCFYHFNKGESNFPQWQFLVHWVPLWIDMFVTLQHVFITLFN